MQLRALGQNSSVGKQCFLGDLVNMTWFKDRTEDAQVAIVNEAEGFRRRKTVMKVQERNPVLRRCLLGHLMDSHFNF